jgi:UDPglucose 6-dehydrogenase
MRIAMIGTGYVGLVSGACFADFGHQVTCVDKDGDKIASLRRGEIPIFEPGLDALVNSNVKAGRLDFATDLTAPVAEADAVFIAVGTPSRRGDGHADLSYVHAAAREIAAVLSGFTVVVTKSTVPVGTGDEVERLIREANPSADVEIASNPEFLREGAVDPRLQISRSHRDRNLGRARAQSARRYLSPAVARPGATDVHRASHRGTDKIRGQRVPCHQDHLHQ